MSFRRAYMNLFVIAALLLLAIGSTGYSPVQAQLDPTDLSVTLAGTSDFFTDSNKFCEPPGSQEGPDGLWLPVVITNTLAADTYTGLVATVAAPANTIVDDNVRYIGNLGPGESATVFFFFDYYALRSLAGCADGVNNWYSENYTITITSVDGGLTAPEVFTDLFENKSMISAAAGGAYASDFLGPGAAVGQIFEQTITYDFGNNPADSALFLQPTGNHDFNDQCYRLVGSEITQSTVVGVAVGTTDQLFFPSTDTANSDIVEIELRWKVLCSPGAESPTFPWAEITSGTQYKYNQVAYGPSDLPLPVP